MSTTEIVTALVLVVLGLVAAAADSIHTKRSLHRLPANTSQGVPSVPTMRERVAVVLFCVFVAGLVGWLAVGLF